MVEFDGGRRTGGKRGFCVSWLMGEGGGGERRGERYLEFAWIFLFDDGADVVVDAFEDLCGELFYSKTYIYIHLHIDIWLVGGGGRGGLPGRRSRDLFSSAMQIT